MAYYARTSKYNPSNMTWQGYITEENKWWYDSSINPGATNNLCLPNCTTYASGRSSEIAGHSVRYEMFSWGGFGNAQNWYGDTSWEKEPYYGISSLRQGDIIVWNIPNINSGHVAVVEYVGSSESDTYLSMSGYVRGIGTRTFYNPGESANFYFQYASLTQTRYWYEQWNGRNGYIVGVIHNPYADGGGPGPGPEPPYVTYYTAYFNTDGGTDIQPQQVEAGHPVTQPENPKKLGWIFDGWFEDSGLETVYDFNAPIWSDVTIYAKWRKNFAVLFPLITKKRKKVKIYE